MSKKLDECFDGFGRVNGVKLKEYLKEKLEQEEVITEPKANTRAKAIEEAIEEVEAEEELSDKDLGEVFEANLEEDNAEPEEE